MNILRVGVLMGGRGSEREVSLNSGRTICDHLDTARYKVIPLFQRYDGTLFLLPWRFLHRGKTSDFEHRLENEAEKISWDSLKELVDFIYTAMHGRFAEDGTLQGLLEVLGIPYLGSKVYASALGMDKIMQKKVLRSGDIPTPQDVVIESHEIVHYVANPHALQSKCEFLGLPLVVKPYKEGSSIGISVVRTYDELLQAIIKAASVGSSSQAVLIEEYIHGMEFSCIVIKDNQTGQWLALTPTEIVSDPSVSFFDYEQKYMPGKSTKFTPARCNQESLATIKKIAIQVTEILEFQTISRIDGFLKKDGTIIITDPNSLAGMAPSSFVFRQAAEINMSHTDFINHLIETELAFYTMLPHADLKKERMTSSQERKRVGVLLGGRSHEKEVSLDSGRNIFYKLSPEKYDPIAFFVSDKLELYRIDQTLLVRNSTKEIAHGLRPEMKVAWNDLPELVDFVFIGLHGDVGENGSVQGTLEMLSLPYNGSSILTSALCMDKYKTGQFLKQEGFNTPEQVLIEKNHWKLNKQEVLKNIAVGPDSPLIVKPHDDGCSVLVFKVNTQKDLEEALESIFIDGKKYALVEEYLQGMELTVGVIGNTTVQALPASQTVTVHSILTMEEKFLPGAGENQTPAPLPDSAQVFIKKTIEEVYRALGGRGYARIDCFYQTKDESATHSERLVILEVNTLPALTPATCLFHQAAEIGLQPMDFIDLIISLGFEEFHRRGTVVATNTKHSLTSIAIYPPALEKL